MANEPSCDPDEILGQTRRLRRLARSLLYDRDRAEDVVQEAWLAALRQGPAEGSLRTWLAGTVRVLARNANRGDVRRQRREEACAQGERLPSAVDTAGRIETLRSLIDAVEKLEEPYRETILLRFFDELAPREVARRQGVPVETVRTRSRRGLLKLRQLLDTRHSDARGAFLGGLVPLAGKMPWAVAAGVPSGSSFLGHLVGGLVVTKPIQLAIAALAIAVLSTLGYRKLVDGERPASPPLPPAAALALAEAPAANEDSETSVQEPMRSVVSLRSTPLARDWVVRGCLTLGITQPRPEGTVRAQLFQWIAGEEGELLQEELLQCDEHGQFAWALSAPETAVTVRVTAEMSGHLGVEHREIVPRGGDAPQELFPRAFPIDRRLVGRVVDAQGKPLAEARVVTFHADTETGPDGRFSQPASSLQKRVGGRVLANGYAEADFHGTAIGAEQIDVGLIVLEPGLDVKGLVVDEAGRPVEGAQVSSSWSGFGKRLDYPLATTDAEGRFHLDQLDPGARRPLCAQKDGFVPSSVDLDPNGGPVTIVLTRGGVVRGRVSMTDGSSSEDVWLSIGFYPTGIPRVDACADAKGWFEFPNVPPGPQTLWAVRKGKLTARLDIDVPELGGVLGGIELELGNGHWLEGLVLDESGEPLPWAVIYVDGRVGRHYAAPREIYIPAYTVTDRDGRFRIEGLPGGQPLNFGFLRQGYSRHEEELADFDRDDLVVRLKRSGRLAGRVIDGATGAPVEAFNVRLVPTKNRPGEHPLEGYWTKWSREGHAFSGTDGYWNADSEELNAGGWTNVEVSAPGFGPTVLRVQSEVEPEVHEFRLYPGSVVRGRVVEAATGLPVAGATVRRSTESETPLQQPAIQEEPDGTETDRQGRFELVGLPAGEMSLRVDHPRWSLAIDGPFVVPEGGAVIEREIEVDEGWTMTGVLLDLEGQPLARETVEVIAIETAGEKYRRMNVATQEDGSFRFEHLLPGTFHVRWLERRGELKCNRITRLVEIEHASREASVRLQATGRSTLRGTLHSDQGLPELVVMTATRVEDVAPDPSAKTHWARNQYGAFAERGSFEMAGLEAGEYTVSCWVTDENGRPIANGSAKFRIPAAGTVDVAIEVRPRRHY